WGEKISDNAVSPEKLVEGLNLSEKQSTPSQCDCSDAHIHKTTKEGPSQLPASGSREDDDLFHDCKDSFDSGLIEENHNSDMDSSEIQTEPDEKDLLELEKNMSEEEKQVAHMYLEISPIDFNGEYFQVIILRILTQLISTLELNPNYIKALLRRAELYEKTEKLDEALEDYKSLLEKDPSIHQAREACMRLPKQIEERNEKLKAEMLSKLKDLGNLVLRPFGLSTENFQVKQDSSTGSYSINFVQNPNNNNR
uniref:Tetratricopeptide repeat domain 1 n=1 Tax=Salvator merianae TaxID=96440 RepID=A0A8D0BAH5_SALMN